MGCSLPFVNSTSVWAVSSQLCGFLVADASEWKHVKKMLADFRRVSNRETPDSVAGHLGFELRNAWAQQIRAMSALIALRVLCNTADSGRDPWYIARSKALSVGLSN